MNYINRNHSSESEQSTRVKAKPWKKTIGITLSRNLIEKGKNL